MLDSRLSPINFIGEDGFHWFIGQVAPAKYWKKEAIKFGYRAKVRIFGRHPASADVKDDDLPWAQFLVPPNFGSGNNFGGASFAVQGGEHVVGFFADGEEMQQPIVIGSFFGGPNVKDKISYDDAISKLTSEFKPFGMNPLKVSNLGTHNKPSPDDISPTESNSTIAAGLISASMLTPNLYPSIKRRINEERIEVDIPNPCEGGNTQMSVISKTIKKFIDLSSRLKKIKGGYVDPVIGKIYNMKKLIKKTAGKVAGKLAQVTRNARKFMFEKIGNLTSKIVKPLDPDQLFKDIEANAAKNDLFCLIENVTKGFKNLMEKFLNGLLGNLVAFPLCAAEQLLGGLLGQINNLVDKAIGNPMNILNKILGPIGSFGDFMSKALNMGQIALNFLKCEGSECEPKPADFVTNVGPQLKNSLNFDEVLNLKNAFNIPGLDVLKNPLGFVDNIFPTPSFGVFTGAAEAVQSVVGGCNPRTKTCGPPRVEIFGGDGIGGLARAVINETGKIVGVNMTEFGSGFTEKPFVSFIDDCDNGRGAVGEAILDDDGNLVNIAILNQGGGYLTPPATNLLTQDRQDDEILNDISDEQGEDVAGIVNDVLIVNPGYGYDPDDIIYVNTPDDISVGAITDSPIATLKPDLDEEGRIIDAIVINSQIGIKDLPELTIPSKNGFGAVIKPVIEYKRVEEFGDVAITDVIRVIDCIQPY